MRCQKRGSLEIGINTIVILVIAMVLLGLGVSFVKDLFETIKPIPAEIPLPEVGVEPSASDPLRLASTDVTIKSGDIKPLKIALYNKWEPTSTYTDWFTIGISTCGDGLASSQRPIIQALPQQILKGSSGAYLVYISAQYLDGDEKKNIPEGSYICNLAAYAGKDDTVTPSTGTIVKSIQIRLKVTG